MFKNVYNYRCRDFGGEYATDVINLGIFSLESFCAWKTHPDQLYDEVFVGNVGNQSCIGWHSARFTENAYDIYGRRYRRMHGSVCADL